MISDHTLPNPLPLSFTHPFSLPSLVLLPHPLLATETEFLDVIGTKVLRVILLAIHSHLY
jgi:hypothetical protein